MTLEEIIKISKSEVNFKKGLWFEHKFDLYHIFNVLDDLELQTIIWCITDGVLRKYIEKKGNVWEYHEPPITDLLKIESLDIEEMILKKYDYNMSLVEIIPLEFDSEESKEINEIESFLTSLKVHRQRIGEILSQFSKIISKDERYSLQFSNDNINIIFLVDRIKKRSLPIYDSKQLRFILYAKIDAIKLIHESDWEDLTV